METPQLLWETVPVLSHSHIEKVSSMFRQNHRCTACAHCLWYCHWALLKKDWVCPLKRDWVCPLHALHSDICRHWWDPLLSLLQVVQSQVSYFSCRRDALVPLSSLWPFTAFSPVDPFLSYIGEPRPALRIWPHLCWAESKDHLP